MVEVDAIDPSVRWLLNDLREGDRRTLDTVVPSLYRHFVHHPAVLQLLHRGLAPQFANSHISARVHTLLLLMKAQARALSGQLGALPAELQEPELVSVMRDFAHRVIPPMIIVGHWLRRSLIPPAADRR
jgi:hypothetical protein